MMDISWLTIKIGEPFAEKLFRWLHKKRIASRFRPRIIGAIPVGTMPCGATIIGGTA